MGREETIILCVLEKVSHKQSIVSAHGLIHDTLLVKTFGTFNLYEFLSHNPLGGCSEFG